MDLHMTDAEYPKRRRNWDASHRAELDAMGIGGTVPMPRCTHGDTWAHNQRIAAEAGDPEAESGRT